MSVEYFAPAPEQGEHGAHAAEPATESAGSSENQTWGSAPAQPGSDPTPASGGQGKPRGSHVKTIAIAGVALAVTIGGGIAVAKAAGNSSSSNGGPGGGFGGQMPNGEGQGRGTFGGGIAVAKAAGNSNSTNGGPGGGGFGGLMPGGEGQGRGTFGGGAGALANALHGDFVVSDGKGGYQTQRLQTGKVTAVSGTALTASSTDGYSQTYVIASSTAVDNGDDAIGDVKTGDTVTIVATVSGTTVTVTTITDTTLAGSSGQGAPGGGQGGKP